VHRSKSGQLMSALGQTRPANADNGFPDVRSTPKADKQRITSASPLSAKSGHTHCSNFLFDHLVGAGDQRWRDQETEDLTSQSRRRFLWVRFSPLGSQP
jgi:hypothetical protein